MPKAQLCVFAFDLMNLASLLYVNNTNYCFASGSYDRNSFRRISKFQLHAKNIRNYLLKATQDKMLEQIFTGLLK